MHEAQGRIDVNAQAGGQPVADVDEVGQLLHEVAAVLRGRGIVEEGVDGIEQLFGFFKDEPGAEQYALCVIPALRGGLFHSLHELGQHGENIVVLRHGHLPGSSRER